MKDGFRALTMIFVAILIAGFLVWWRGAGDEEITPLGEVTVGIQTSPPMAIVMVAEDKGFDIANGIDIKIKEFTAGKFALQAFLGGSLDVAVSGDVPVALAKLQPGNDFVVVGQVVKKTVHENRVVARKDGEYTSAKEYFEAKRRKVATSFSGSPEFFMYELLRTIEVPLNQVELISQAPGDMPAALASGSVDAIAVFDPFAYIAEKQLGEEALTFTNSEVYSGLYVIDVQRSLARDQDRIEAFLQSLVDAQEFIAANPDEAKQIVVKYTKLDRETVDAVWDNFDFQVALTPELINLWQRQAQWAIDTGKAEVGATIPDFREVIYDQPLRNISPGAVEL